MAQPAYVVAQQSYSRCLRAPDFFEVLYDTLLASHPAIEPMFAETEFPRQHRLLQHGLGLLLSYSKQPDKELLERIAARHSVRGIDVPPELYSYFVESLLSAVQASDPRFDDDVAEAWRDAIQPGLEFMQERYRA